MTVPGSFSEPGVTRSAFPLTPTLSRGERENVSQRCLTTRAFRFVGACLPLLPLPAGEGRGRERPRLRQ